MSSLRSRARESKVVTTPSAHHHDRVSGTRFFQVQSQAYAVQRHRTCTWRNKSVVRQHNRIPIPEACSARLPRFRPGPPTQARI